MDLSHLRWVNRRIQGVSTPGDVKMVSQLIIEYPDNFPDAIGQTSEAFEQEAN
ncbi:MAG: hypothetical protein F6K48_31740 [Okeania sp. SIO3H1]|nr:hypothetical protein [Okeania sp. SIO3H1]